MVESIMTNSKRLTPGEYRKVRKCIESHLDVFAINALVVWPTNLVQNRINIGYAPPIRQDPKHHILPIGQTLRKWPSTCWKVRSLKRPQVRGRYPLKWLPKTMDQLGFVNTMAGLRKCLGRTAFHGFVNGYSLMKFYSADRYKIALSAGIQL